MSIIGIKIQENNVIFAGTQDEVYNPAVNEIKNAYCDGVQVQNKYNNNGGNSIEVLHEYTNGVLTWDTTGTAPPIPPETVVNSITLTNTGTSTEINVPVQIGRQFVEGEIADYPQVSINDTLYSTQANVKTRWSDGSVKHTIINFIIPNITAGQELTVLFVNQATTLDTAMTKTEMLAMTWEAKMQFEFPAVELINARTMIGTDHYEYWLEGPIATSIIIVDHSAARIYDVGTDTNRSIRPSFHITFWPTIDKYQVRYVGGNENVETGQEQTYDLTLMIDADVVKYTNTGIANPIFGKWTRQFWGGTEPIQLNIDHNLPYLIKSLALPNYKTDVVIPEDRIIQLYSDWQTSDKDLFERGLWQPGMGTTGGRLDIGMYNGWEAAWVHSWDSRLLEICKSQAEQACAWPIWLREGDPNMEFYDHSETTPAMGMPISIAPKGRRSHWTRPAYWDYYQLDADHQINIIGDHLNYVWKPDTAHFYNMSSIYYLLTGEFFALDLMVFSATYVLGDNNGNATNFLGRGPTGTEGMYCGAQTRGSGWALNIRCITEDILPDDHPTKAYLKPLNENMIAGFEGWHGLVQSYPELSAMYSHGVTAYRPGRYAINGLVSPFGNWTDGNTTYGGYVDRFYTDLLQTGSAPWQHNYFSCALGRAKELGYKTENVLAFTTIWLRGLFSDVSFEKAMIGAYVYAAIKDDDNWCDDIQEVYSMYRPEYIAECITYSATDINAMRYDHLSAGAMSFVSDLPYGNAGWTYCLANTISKECVNENPMWTFLPRT